MIALDAKTGHLVETFGKKGMVDLKLEDDQELDLTHAIVGLNAPPLVAGDVVVVGAAHAAWEARKAQSARSDTSAALTSEPANGCGFFTPFRAKGEFGYDTWLDGSAEKNGNLGAWGQLSADLAFGPGVHTDAKSRGTITMGSIGRATVSLRKA